MIVNLGLKLKDNKQLRLWADETFIPEWKIRRMFLALSNANSLDEQMSIINELPLNNEYSTSGEVTMFYVDGEDVVKVCNTNYDSENNLFRRGAVIRTINLQF